RHNTCKTCRAAAARKRVSVSEQPTYTRDAPHSFFKDLIEWNGGKDMRGAQERLARHTEEMRDIKGRSGGGGSGFIPPVWLSEDYAPLARAPRPIADLSPSRPMPPQGIDAVKVPQLTGGAAVAVQDRKSTRLNSSH